QIQRLLWEGVLCQFVIEDRANGFPLGLVTGHRAEWNRLAISFHATIEPELVHDIAVSEAVLRFLDYLFATFAIHKLYVEYPEGDQTLAVIEKALGQRGRDVLQREGRLRSWVTIEGRPHDVVIASVLRSAWVSPGDLGRDPTEAAVSTPPVVPLRLPGE
ncbi:MAG TPA: GNAT family protein, partial [Acidimicrobiales bacterium]|nr:GNAT family protein [Acidimicrobiales bacterium]